MTTSSTTQSIKVGDRVVYEGNEYYVHEEGPSYEPGSVYLATAPPGERARTRLLIPRAMLGKVGETAAEFNEVIEDDDDQRWSELARINPNNVTTPKDVLLNAHRAYEFLDEIGAVSDSIARESIFAWAAQKLGVDYEKFYSAWINHRPYNEDDSIWDTMLTPREVASIAEQDLADAREEFRQRYQELLADYAGSCVECAGIAADEVITDAGLRDKMHEMLGAEYGSWAYRQL